MLRTVAPGLLVALLVVTAGCTGGGDPGATPTVEASSGGGDGGGDGGDADGADGATIVQNRTAALVEAGSYTSVWRMRSLEEGTLVGELSYTTAMDRADERYSFEMRATNEGETRTSMASYYADGRTYQRIGEGDEATYTSAEGEFGTAVQFGQTAFVSSTGDLDDFTFAGTETYDGVQVRRYVMEETAPWIAAQQVSDGDVRWTDFSYEVLVDERGLVRSERWGGTGVENGTEMTIEFSYELTGVGSTEVTEPPWLGQVPS